MEGDKIGMVWYTMYAWCIKIVYSYQYAWMNDDGMLYNSLATVYSQSP